MNTRVVRNQSHNMNANTLTRCTYGDFVCVFWAICFGKCVKLYYLRFVVHICENSRLIYTLPIGYRVYKQCATVGDVWNLLNENYV